MFHVPCSIFHHKAKRTQQGDLLRNAWKCSVQFWIYDLGIGGLKTKCWIRHNMCHFLDVALLSGKIVFKRAAVVTVDLQSSSALALAVPFCLTLWIQERGSAQLSSISLHAELQICLININGSSFFGTLLLCTCNIYRRMIDWHAATIHHCYLMLSPRPE